MLKEEIKRKEKKWSEYEKVGSVEALKEAIISERTKFKKEMMDEKSSASAQIEKERKELDRKSKILGFMSERYEAAEKILDNVMTIARKKGVSDRELEAAVKVGKKEFRELGQDKSNSEDIDYKD